MWRGDRTRASRPQGGIAGFLGPHAAVDVVAGLPLDVVANVPVKGGFDSAGISLDLRAAATTLARAGPDAAGPLRVAMMQCPAPGR